MEKESLRLATDRLKEENVPIHELVTDHHMQVQMWIRENLTKVDGTKHSYDVWHIAKGIKKKLSALLKQKDCDVIGKWVKSIINHAYWSAASTPEGDGDMIVAKWLSVVNHVQTVHRGHGPKFSRCLQEDLEHREWLKPGTKACAKVEDLITSTRLCNDMRKLSTGAQTSDLEAFHSVVNHFAPKQYSFKYYGQLCRQHLGQTDWDIERWRNSHTSDIYKVQGRQ